jgi:SAM-dependent methyltransferase
LDKDETRIWPQIISQVTQHHAARYLWATKMLPRRAMVLDAACGVGYGAFWMHQWGMNVTGVDIDQDAIDHAEKYFPGPKYLCFDLLKSKFNNHFGVLVTFETLEHLEKPEILLTNVDVEYVIASVPNEVLVPFNPEKYMNDKYPHQRHYTPEEFETLLTSTGYQVEQKLCQVSKNDNKIREGVDGQFLIYVAKKI